MNLEMHPDHATPFQRLRMVVPQQQIIVHYSVAAAAAAAWVIALAGAFALPAASPSILAACGTAIVGGAAAYCLLAMRRFAAHERDLQARTSAADRASLAKSEFLSRMS